MGLNISFKRLARNSSHFPAKYLNRGKNCHILDTFYMTESEVAQSCPTLCDPMNCSMPGSSLSMEFSRQESWSGLPLPSPGDLPNIEPRSPALQADSLPSEPQGKPYVTLCQMLYMHWVFNLLHNPVQWYSHHFIDKNLVLRKLTVFLKVPQ